MGLSKFEMYHGAVLTEVVRNPEMSLKLIERDSEKHSWGMYSIISGNKDYVLFIKSTAQIRKGKKEDSSKFTFSIEDIKRLKNVLGKELIVCLVCHDEHICLLTKNDINDLKILDRDKTCGISVYWKERAELRIKSPFAELGHKVPRNRLKKFEWGK